MATKTKHFFQELCSQYGVSKVARIFGVSDVTMYKYCEGKEFETDSGCRNPLDNVVSALNYSRELGNYSISELLQNILFPQGRLETTESPEQVIIKLSLASQKSVVDFLKAIEDGTITPSEKKEILNHIGQLEIEINKIKAVLG